jgi:hypothetical protein
MSLTFELAPYRSLALAPLPAPRFATGGYVERTGRVVLRGCCSTLPARERPERPSGPAAAVRLHVHVDLAEILVAGMNEAARRGRRGR